MTTQASSLQRRNLKSVQDTGTEKERLEDELQRIKTRVPMGSEVTLQWMPGTVKLRNGRQLEEEVVGNRIFVYAENLDRAVELVAHGFAEWLLNQHSKPYRQMINKLIEFFEETQYGQKEKIADAVTKLLKGT